MGRYEFFAEPTVVLVPSEAKIRFELGTSGFIQRLASQNMLPPIPILPMKRSTMYLDVLMGTRITSSVSTYGSWAVPVKIALRSIGILSDSASFRRRKIVTSLWAANASLTPPATTRA